MNDGLGVGGLFVFVVFGLGVWFGCSLTDTSWQNTVFRPPCEHVTYNAELATIVETCDTYGCLDTKRAALRELRGCK